MKSFPSAALLISTALFLFTLDVSAGNTGKVAGTVKNKLTGEALTGAGILIEKIFLETISDSAGQYTILSIPPGVYSVQISLAGYRKFISEKVIVSIDQTTWLDAELEAESIKNDSAIIAVEKIKANLFKNTIYIPGNEIEELPVSNIISAAGLYAGIRGGWNSGYNTSLSQSVFNENTQGKITAEGDLNIRGNDGESILFLIDGAAQRDPRNNKPLTTIPLSAVEEAVIEQGGINAEYGQVRSGILYIIPKEGSRQDYSGSIQVRYSPAAPKYWKGGGITDAGDPNSFALRSYFDPAVCWTGTANGAWDNYTRRQYPAFEGWNIMSQRLLTDEYPGNDFTPAALQQIFKYETRKKLRLNEPDYDIDAGFGGPVPLLADMLGDLRFFTAYRSTREMLLIPLSRPDYKDYAWTLHLNSDISKSIRLRFFGSFGKQYTIRNNSDPLGVYTYLDQPEEIAGAIGLINSYLDFFPMFSDFYFSNAEIGHSSYSARFTHSVNVNTFYEVSVDYFSRDYNVYPPGLRDTSIQYEIVPGFFEDSNPLGYWPYVSKGLFLTSSWDAAIPFDFTAISSVKLKADFSHQFNFQNLIKAGVEADFHNLEFNYGNRETIMSVENKRQINSAPIYGGLYIQDKFETKKFCINAGLRLDFTDLNMDWLDLNPDNLFYFEGSINSLPKKHSAAQWRLSPRLGAGWQFIDNAKVFFNYGHYNQTIKYENMYRSDVSVGDPNAGFIRNITYELGFDFIFFKNFVFEAAAFLTDISNQSSYISYISQRYGIIFSQPENTGYEEIKGFELTIRKNSGEWLTGFINYTYNKNKTGFEGSSRYYDYQPAPWDGTTGFNEVHPDPRPYARANIKLRTPYDFGPSIKGYSILSELALNIIADWQAGYSATYNPKSLPNISNNIRSVDFFNLALRLDKTIDFGKFKILLFMDMDNVLNTKRLWNNFDGSFDSYYYLSSLHLPVSDAYDNIPGEDKIGDYREPGAEFQPMEHVNTLNPNGGNTRAWYYEEASGKYFEWKNNIWSEVEKSRLDKALEDKAYIDMPNASTFWFLDPRKIYFGLKISFSL